MRSPRSLPTFLPALGVGLLLAAASTVAGPQTETIAGTGVRGNSLSGPAIAAQLDNPFGVLRGPDGAVWFAEYEGQRICRIAPDGTLQVRVGTGKTGYSGDGGPATAATLRQPHEIRFDAAGNLFISDMANHAIRRVDARTGIITTVAGTGKPGYSGDGGPASQAQLNNPISIQFAPDGDLFVCDIGNHVLRRVNPRTGIISTFVGTGRPGPTPEGSPISGTPLNGPRSLDFDAQGNLWLVTREGNQVFRFDLAAGRIHHVAGTGAKGFTGNGGPATQATLSGPKGIAVAPNGDVYLADTESHSIRRIDPKTGVLTVVVGTGEKGDGPDGNPVQCRLARPHGIWVDRDGTLFIGDSENHRVRIVRPAP
ncbi:MAG: hypothetical protein JNL10_21135 [Verrucomicrobiales bacterium]|nr:hypothetical protein [Verrucomicrobiales bacterium]